MARKVVVVGRGIVGISIARELAGKPGFQVTVMDRDQETLRGSTAFAPGFVGVYNDAPLLVELARVSTSVYRTLRVGYREAGGLELATSTTGAAEVERRSAAAHAAGLNSRMVPASGLPGAVLDFVDEKQIVAAAYCSDDAVVEPSVLVAGLYAEAAARGARFVNGNLIALEASRQVIAATVSTGERLLADDVVLAGGIWGAHLADMVGLSLPLVPVAHPYVYSSASNQLAPGPFVRWPERHVYSRVHGDRLGIGSYDHAPVPVGLHSLQAGAGLSWDAAFDPVVESAQSLLRASARFQPHQRINGVFAMTPDNLPFIGRHPTVPGVWFAQAIWVTHGAGAAARLANAMSDDTDLPDELAVTRFAGRPEQDLREAALRLYRDIYANESR